MKFSIDRNALSDTLRKVSLALPAKALSETLKTFVFEVENDDLKVSATDTMTTITVTQSVFDAEESNYRAILPADKLLNIAKTASEGELTFDIAPRKAIITSRKSEWALNLLDASQYPSLADVKDLKWKPVNRVPFLEALSAVQTAASFDSSSPGLCMVNVSNGIFRASDRVRMHQVESEYGVPDFSIPSFSLKSFMRLLQMSSSEEFHIVRGTNGFMAKVDNSILTVAGLEAEFPDVTGTLLKPTLVNTVEVSVDVQDLVNAIQRTRVTVDEETRLLNIKVSPKGMVVSTKDTVSNSRASEQVEVAYAGSETVTANVNAYHMQAALSSVPVSSATLTFGKNEGTKLPSVRIYANDNLYNAVLSQTRTDLL